MLFQFRIEQLNAVVCLLAHSGKVISTPPLLFGLVMTIESIQVSKLSSFWRMGQPSLIAKIL